MAKLKGALDPRLEALERSVEDYAPVFKKLRGSVGLADYLSAKGDRADEEILTEPILRSLIERVLGFPKGRYLEQTSASSGSSVRSTTSRTTSQTRSSPTPSVAQGRVPPDTNPFKPVQRGRKGVTMMHVRIPATPASL
jgi:hypothetical protein